MHRAVGRLLSVWLGVIALISLNQVLVIAYVDRVWHGDPIRAAASVPSGWFRIATSGPVAWIAHHTPGAADLGFSLFRVQAFLELPFVMLAYTLVCGYVSARALRVATSWPMLWLTSIAWTGAFIWAECEFWSAWTGVDLVLRVIAAVAVPPLVRTLAAEESAVDAGRWSLMRGVVATGLVSSVILLMYDAALLYNSARLAPALLWAGVCMLALLGLARRQHAGSPEGTLSALIRSAYARLLVTFMVIALPARYAMNFGARAVVAAAVAGIVLTVAGWSLWCAASSWSGRRAIVVRLLPAVVVAGGAGLGARTVVQHLAPAYPEIRLAVEAGCAAVMLVLAAAVTDRRSRSEPS